MPTRSHRTSARFVERFTARYEQAEVPLVDVLDEEIGIGFSASDDPGGEPLLVDIGPFATTLAPRSWQARDEVLLRILSDANRSAATQVELAETDLVALAAKTIRHRCRMLWKCSRASPPRPPRRSIVASFAS